MASGIANAIADGIHAAVDGGIIGCTAQDYEELCEAISTGNHEVINVAPIYSTRTSSGGAIVQRVELDEVASPYAVRVE